MEHPLRSDNPAQARIHQGQHQARRTLLGKLLTVVDANPLAGPGSEEGFCRRLASKLTHCGAHPVLYADQATGRLIQSQALCRSRICPTCGMHRSHRLKSQIDPMIRSMDEAKLLTLTLAASDEPLKDQIKRLVGCASKLRQRRQWKKLVRGGLYVLEITYNAKTDRWHPHLHLVIDATYWPQRAISNEWLAVTGDSPIVHVRALHNRKAACRYVAKYCSKTQADPGLPSHRIAEWASAVHGARMIQTFGTLHGQKLAKEKLPANNGLRHVAHLEPLHIEAQAGDELAASLIAELRNLPPWPENGDYRTLAVEMRAVHKLIARRFEAWSAWYQGEQPDPRPPEDRPLPPEPRPPAQASLQWYP